MITYRDITLMHVLNTPVTQYGMTIKKKLLIWTPLRVHIFFKCPQKGSLCSFNWIEKLIIILFKNIYFLKCSTISLHFFIEEKLEKNPFN